MPDYHRSMIINALLTDYVAVAASLKALRGQPFLARTVERHRSLATGWFNRVALLYRHGLLSADDLQLVASPRAAQLWVRHVAPLDKAVREKSQGQDPEGRRHPIEHFWREYAEGRLVIAPHEEVP